MEYNEMRVLIANTLRRDNKDYISIDITEDGEWRRDFSKDRELYWEDVYDMHFIRSYDFLDYDTYMTLMPNLHGVYYSSNYPYNHYLHNKRDLVLEEYNILPYYILGSKKNVGLHCLFGNDRHQMKKVSGESAYQLVTKIATYQIHTFGDYFIPRQFNNHAIIYNNVNEDTNIEGYNYFVSLDKNINGKYIPLFDNENRLLPEIKEILNKCDLSIGKRKINGITKYMLEYNGHHLLTVSYLKKMHYNIYELLKKYIMAEHRVVHYFDKYWLEETTYIECIGTNSEEEAKDLLDKVNAALSLEDLAEKELRN